MFNSKIKIIILAGTIVFQVLISFTLILFVFKPPEQPENLEQQVIAEEDEKAKEEKVSIGEVFMIEDLVINPAGTQGRRFISLSIGFEVNDGCKPDDLKIREPKIVDLILTILSQKGLVEFINTNNRERIRSEILESVKEITPENLIKQVYITKFIVQ